MLTNADITIYNHIYDKATRLDEWRRTVIHGVHFYVDNKVSVGDSARTSIKSAFRKMPNVTASMPQRTNTLLRIAQRGSGPCRTGIMS